MSLNLNINYGGSNWNVGGTQGSTGTTGTTGTQLPTFQDNIVNLGGLSISYNYEQDSGNPALMLPNDFASTQLPQQWTGERTSNEAFENAYYSAFADQLQQLIDGPPHLTQAQAQELVFAHMTGEPIPDDTFLNDQLTGLEEKVNNEMVQTFGEDAFPSVANQAKALKGGGDSVIGNSRAQLQKLQDYIKTLPDGPEKQKLQQFLDQANSNLANIQQTLDQLQNASNRQQFSQLLGQLQDQMNSFSGQLSEADGLTSDPNVGAVLSEITGNIGSGMSVFSDNISKADQTNQLAQGNWESVLTETGSTFKAALTQAFEGSFENSLSKYATEHGLSESEVAELRFAHFNPDAEGIDPHIKSMLGDINADAVAHLSPAWGVPPGYVPTVDNMKFNAQIESAFDDAFQQVLQSGNLQDVAQAVGMSEEDLYGALEFLHDNPDLVEQMKGDNSLLGKMLGLDSQEKFQKILDLLSQFEGEATAQVSSQYGVPSGFNMKGSGGDYTTMLNGRFLQQFDYNLRNQQPPLTQQQIADVRAALSDPLNPSVTAETRSIIQQVYTQSVADVRTEYNVPVGWAPPITNLSSINNVSPTLRMANAGIEQAEEGLHLMSAAVSQMPDGPDKALLINVLKIVSEAIAKLKERIAVLEQLDSEISKKLTESQKEKGLYKADLQMEKIKEMEKKKAKMAPFMGFMKIFGPIMKVIMAIVMLVMAAFTGPLGFIIGAVMFAATIQDIATGGKQNFMTDMFKAIMDHLPSPLNIIISTYICIAMTLASGGAGIFIGMDLFFEKSGIIQQIVKQCGGDEMAQEITNMACQIAAEIILAIIMTIVTGGAALAPMVGEIAAKAAATVAKVLLKVAQMLEKVGAVMEKVANALTKVAAKLQKFADEMANLAKTLEKVNKEVANLEKAQKAAKKAGDVDKAAELGEKLKYAKSIQEDLAGRIEGMLNLGAKLLKFFEVGSQTLEGLNKIDQARIAFIQADLAEILGELDAEIAELEAMIKLLRKVIDSMMSGIQANAEWMTELGNLQSKMWGDLSQTATAVAGANDK